jgi:hypothetical protein
MIALVLVNFGCGSTTQPKAAPKPAPVEHAKIVQFYPTLATIPKGLTGKICYGVENTKKLELKPPDDDVYPALTRCFDISPKKTTTYTLTAYGEDGVSDSKSIEVRVGAPPPRLYDLWVNSIDVGKGEEVRVCFKLENVTKVRVGPGKLDAATNCLTDRPSKTTVYKITALGGDNQMDSGTVTVKVH